MSLRFLLDTNILSEAIRPNPNERVARELERQSGHLATASVVWHELLFGFAALPQGRRRREGERYLELVVGKNIPVLPYDADAAQWHADERARLRSVGKSPPFSDGQIAAVAAVNGLTLVTENMTDFAQFRGLRVVDWSE